MTEFGIIIRGQYYLFFKYFIEIIENMSIIIYNVEVTSQIPLRVVGIFLLFTKEFYIYSKAIENIEFYNLFLH